MKKMYFAAMAFAVLALGACSSNEVVEAEEVTYNLNVEATTLGWTGSYVSDGHTHTGTVNVTDGSVVYKGDEFVSGSFNVDLNSIVCTDLEGDKNAYLVGHLKSGDFFDVEKYAKVPVVINSVSDKEITATLTVLGKEVKAVMPVSISKDENGMTAKGKFDIDFASTDMPGFKAGEGKPENERVETVMSFDLNLVLKK
jgi:polyisoprenoid-binding protein YceI